MHQILNVRRTSFENGVIRTVEIDDRKYLVSEDDVSACYRFMQSLAEEGLAQNEVDLRLSVWLETFEAGIRSSRPPMPAPAPAS